MSQNVFDEGGDDLRFAFGLDFQRIGANVTGVARHVVTCGDAADRLTKKHALNDPANFDIAALAHGAYF